MLAAAGDRLVAIDGFMNDLIHADRKLVEVSDRRLWPHWEPSSTPLPSMSTSMSPRRWLPGAETSESDNYAAYHVRQCRRVTLPLATQVPPTLALPKTR
jgi:hypothetical protein